MKASFIGGTGIISTACTQFSIEQEIDLTLLNRGRRSVDVPGEVKALTAIPDETVVDSEIVALGGPGGFPSTLSRTTAPVRLRFCTMYST